MVMPWNVVAEDPFGGAWHAPFPKTLVSLPRPDNHWLVRRKEGVLFSHPTQKTPHNQPKYRPRSVSTRLPHSSSVPRYAQKSSTKNRISTNCFTSFIFSSKKLGRDGTSSLSLDVYLPMHRVSVVLGTCTSSVPRSYLSVG